jgi:hypothetical protein
MLLHPQQLTALQSSEKWENIFSFIRVDVVLESSRYDH